jgi:hypothetical protein
LGLLQIAVEKNLVGMIEGGLRTLATVTAQPAGDQKKNTENYGAVLPLPLLTPAARVPCPTQPILILMQVSSK